MSVRDDHRGAGHHGLLARPPDRGRAVASQAADRTARSAHRHRHRRRREKQGPRNPFAPEPDKPGPGRKDEFVSEKNGLLTQIREMSNRVNDDLK